LGGKVEKNVEKRTRKKIKKEDHQNYGLNKCADLGVVGRSRELRRSGRGFDGPSKGEKLAGLRGGGECPDAPTTKVNWGTNKRRII